MFSVAVALVRSVVLKSNFSPSHTDPVFAWCLEQPKIEKSGHLLKMLTYESERTSVLTLETFSTGRKFHAVLTALIILGWGVAGVILKR